MVEGKKVITRRDFIRTGSCVAVGSLVGLPVLGRAGEKEADPKKSRVVLIRNEEVLDRRGIIRSGVLEEMLDRAVSTLAGAPDAPSAWSHLFRAGDVVGVKSNAWYHLPTPPSLESAILRRLAGAGMAEANMAVDDRGVRDNPVFKRATALINVRPMRTHHWSGLGTLLKNYIMFVPAPFMYHSNACANLGAIWQTGWVQGKTRLNILVLLTPLFHGVGPHHFSRQHTWNYCGLIVSADPVAADATGARIIQAKRDAFFGEERPISPPPRHIAVADTRFKLGNSNPDRIELIKLGWDKDILI